MRLRWSGHDIQRPTADSHIEVPAKRLTHTPALRNRPHIRPHADVFLVDPYPLKSGHESVTDRKNGLSRSGTAHRQDAAQNLRSQEGLLSQAGGTLVQEST
jgi:hypothetical protein